MSESIHKVSAYLPISSQMYADLVQNPPILTEWLIGEKSRKPGAPVKPRPQMGAALLWTALRLAYEDDPLGSALLRLHCMRDHDLLWPDCDGCDFGGYDAEPPSWPCRTVALLAEHIGIEWDGDWL